MLHITYVYIHTHTHIYIYTHAFVAAICTVKIYLCKRYVNCIAVLADSLLELLHMDLVVQEQGSPKHA